MIEVGIDQHKRFSVAAQLNDETGGSESRRLEHWDTESIRRYFRSIGGQVRASVESTGNWYWLVDLLEEEGVEVQLCNNTETRRLLKARAKNDRLDALALAELSARGILPQVYVPPREIRDSRERHRYRIRIVRIQTRLKNIIHSTLGKLNIPTPFSDLFGKRGRAFLDRLDLREPYQAELRSALRILDAVETEVNLMRDEIRKTLNENPLAELLQTAPGIAELTTYLLLHEIGPVERFRSQKEFVNYCCLAPGTWQSAQRRRDLPIGRHGNLYLKAALTEAAQTAVRIDPTLGAFYRRLQRRKGTGSAMAAAARKLAVAVYQMLKGRTPYRPATSAPSTVLRTGYRPSGKPVLFLGQRS